MFFCADLLCKMFLQKGFRHHSCVFLIHFLCSKTSALSFKISLQLNFALHFSVHYYISLLRCLIYQHKTQEQSLIRPIIGEPLTKLCLIHDYAWQASQNLVSHRADTLSLVERQQIPAEVRRKWGLKHWEWKRRYKPRVIMSNIRSLPNIANQATQEGWRVQHQRDGAE